MFRRGNLSYADFLFIVQLWDYSYVPENGTENDTLVTKGLGCTVPSKSFQCCKIYHCLNPGNVPAVRLPYFVSMI